VTGQRRRELTLLNAALASARAVSLMYETAGSDTVYASTKLETCFADIHESRQWSSGELGADGSTMRRASSAWRRATLRNRETTQLFLHPAHAGRGIGPAPHANGQATAGTRVRRRGVPRRTARWRP
jgi:hypothetical protein